MGKGGGVAEMRVIAFAETKLVGSGDSHVGGLARVRGLILATEAEPVEGLRGGGGGTQQLGVGMGTCSGLETHSTPHTKCN